MARTPLPVGLSYRGKTALVTGANTGLGYAVAALLLRHDISCLILGVRTIEKGESTKARLLQEPATKAQGETPDILFYTMDMLSGESVVEFSEQILTQVPKLDIVILNGGRKAGMMTWNYAKSSFTENESTYQVNHLSTAMLAVYLLPLLKKSSAPGQPTHLTIIGSALQLFSPFIKKPIPDDRSVVEYMNDPETFSTLNRYSDTKLLIGTFTRELATRINPAQVIVHDVDPGILDTDLGRNVPGPLKPVAKVFGWMVAKPPHVGAAVVLHAVERGNESHGKFVDIEKVKSATFKNEEMGRRMTEKNWKETIEIVDKFNPESMKRALE
ncbi:NAD(P)-binding protein [Gymnopus androsaceus JB14]|uniref:NAD(P)-binding protein n=1 Tax=Gymnopus androsaceus JB14 TaxID=1447944 RepID=A0A6A4HY78_9AGAR|nr:NAD(P)-binding protein [Gymnopus androsaceus JB14]